MATDNGQVESQESLEQVDTTTSDETASQTSSESHDGADNASEASQTDKSHEAKEDDPIARERQKMSVLESRAAKLERENRSHKEWVLQKESRTRDYFESLGYTPDKVEQFVTTIKQNNPALWQDPQAVQQPAMQPQYDPGQIAQTVKTEIELENAQRGFFNATPDFSPENVAKLSEDERIAKAVMAKAIEDMAFAMAQKNGRQVPTTDMYISARDRLMPSSALEKAREEGEVEGMARANASRASDFSTTSGSQKSSGVQLTAEERAIAARLKIAPEEYAKHKVE